MPFATRSGKHQIATAPFGGLAMTSLGLAGRLLLRKPQLRFARNDEMRGDQIATAAFDSLAMTRLEARGERDKVPLFFVKITKLIVQARM